MRDIWNPWYGCRKVGEGCRNCYMHHLADRRGRDGTVVVRSTSGFHKPLARDRQGRFVYQPGETIRVCMTSDFFLEEADSWRPEAWDIIRQRPDLIFFLLTRRPERVAGHLPSDWGAGWPNVMLNVSCENQAAVDLRVPVLLDLPFQRRGIMAAPLIGPLSLGPYLARGALHQVVAGGENYGGQRPLHWEWIEQLKADCQDYGVRFVFIETGTQFVKSGRMYRLTGRRLQSIMAWKSKATSSEPALTFELQDDLGFPIPTEALHRPTFRTPCESCGSRPICNGCSGCRRCLFVP
jgi:protein gp37